MITKQLLKIWLLYVHIINLLEILFKIYDFTEFTYKWRLQYLYNLHFVNIASNFGDNTEKYIFKGHIEWKNYKYNKVKHDNFDWSIETSHYLQSTINVLKACHFTYLQIPDWNRISENIVYFMYSSCTAAKFYRITLL